MSEDVSPDLVGAVALPTEDSDGTGPTGPGPLPGLGPTDLALEAGRVGTFRWDLRGGGLRWDPVGERIFGMAPGTAPRSREDYLALVHPDDRAAVHAAGERAIRSGGVRDVEHRLILPDGSLRWVLSSSRLVRGADGQPEAFVGVNVDITARKLVEERLEFLSHAGEVLGSSLDLHTTFQQVCDLATEQLADWCSIDLRDGDTVRLAALAHRDPDKISYARRLRERFPVDLDAEQGLALVLRTSEPQLLPDLDESYLRGVLAEVPEFSAQDVEEFLALGLRSSLVVPLRTPSGTVLGGLTLIAEQGRRRYDQADVTLALEVARRAAVAVENAQLYERIRRTARTLQRSLLPTEIPTLPFGEVAVDYQPLETPEMVGGDFYDVFETLGGRWCLIIGDVAGKGVEAGALTAAARWTLRTIMTRDASAAGAIHQLNDHLVRQDWGERFVTVLAAVAEPADDGVMVHYASGGHPAPVLRRADGTARELDAAGPLIGMFTDAPPPRAHSIHLHPGDSLLLYTDGITDTRHGNDWFDPPALCQALQDAPGGATTQDLLTQLTTTVARHGRQRDDRALLIFQARTAE